MLREMLPTAGGCGSHPSSRAAAQSATSSGYHSTEQYCVGDRHSGCRHEAAVLRCSPAAPTCPSARQTCPPSAVPSCAQLPRGGAGSCWRRPVAAAVYRYAAAEVSTAAESAAVSVPAECAESGKHAMDNEGSTRSTCKKAPMTPQASQQSLKPSRSTRS